MRVLQVIMGMGFLVMMGVHLSSGRLGRPTTGFKTLVVPLRRQRSVRRKVRLFHVEPFLNHVVVVHRIHSMTLGGKMIMTRGALRNAIRRSPPIILSVRPTVGAAQRDHGRPMTQTPLANLRPNPLTGGLHQCQCGRSTMVAVAEATER